MRPRRPRRSRATTGGTASLPRLARDRLRRAVTEPGHELALERPTAGRAPGRDAPARRRTRATARLTRKPYARRRCPSGRRVRCAWFRKVADVLSAYRGLVMRAASFLHRERHLGIPPSSGSAREASPACGIADPASRIFPSAPGPTTTPVGEPVPRRPVHEDRHGDIRVLDPEEPALPERARARART